ncbi:MAG: cytochrome c biogenesis CcdA family protein [Actinomycetota bacterium]
MIDAPIAFAFASGLVASVNPCGFPLLPAYLSYFIGTDGDEQLDSNRSVGRALAVSATVSLGFLAVFGVAGAFFAHVSSSVLDWSPWITVAIGAVLAVLGVAMLAGFEPAVVLPKLNRGGRSRGVGSMFVFGVSYAVASLSCTLPVFLSAVGTVFTRSNFVSGVAVFAAYSAGMALVLMVLTVGLALARHSLVTRLRQAMRYVQRAAGVLLIIAGAYVAWYGITEIRLDSGATGGGAVDFVTDLSAEISTWVQDTGATRIGVVLAVLVAAATAYSLGRRRRA